MFKYLITVATLSILAAVPANARAHYRHSHHHGHHRVHNDWPSQQHHGGGLVTIATAVNPITVAAGYADKFRGLISDLVSHGYRGPINCYARGGHVPGSLHYRGEACDFAQTGWGRTPARIMYHARAIIARHGLRDGCDFGDCGHVDSGARLSGHRYARHRTRHVRYAYASQ